MCLRGWTSSRRLQVKLHVCRAINARPCRHHARGASDTAALHACPDRPHGALETDDIRANWFLMCIPLKPLARGRPVPW